jgi:hypothetical protein
MALAEKASDERKEYFSVYVEYNKVLRTWFVTFGIGGPLLLLANPAITATLIKKASLRPVVFAFLVGCAVQILNVILNKTSSWYAHSFCDDETAQPNSLIRFLIRTQKMYWIDAVVDITTFIVFGYSVIRLLIALI